MQEVCNWIAKKLFDLLSYISVIYEFLFSYYNYQQRSRPMSRTVAMGVQCPPATKHILFSSHRYICKKSRFPPVIYLGIVTIEDEYKVLCAVSNSATFDDLE